MKKKLLLPIYISFSCFYFAQVGINQPNPNLSADLELGSTNKSLLLNRVPNTAAINNPVNGMLIYDVAEQCVKAFQGGAWSQCFWKETPTVFALNCSSATFTPSTAIKGTPYSGTLTIPYTGGDGSAYAAQSVQSNGLTAVLPAGNLAVGNGTLQYTVSGIPTNIGPTTFNISLKGSTCTSTALSVNSPTPVIPPTITMKDDIYFIASVYDNDYAPYTAPTGPATTARPVAADGVADKLADYQGIIPTSGLDVLISVTTTGSGNLPAWEGSIITIPAELTENGVSGKLKLSWGNQSYTSTTTSIKATLSAVDTNLLARKLDINAGIGSDYLGVLLGRFQFPSGGTATKNYDVRILPGIPDRQMGLPDNNNAISHNFLYLPVQAEDGNLWLNNNLGADYANIDNPSFNIVKQATSATDYHAYGSLFQWGRKPDGHELIIWTSSSDGTPVTSATVSGPITPEPTNAMFVKAGGDWRQPSNKSLWLTSTSPNNPCPIGFKVPSQTQLQNYVDSAKLQAGVNGAAAAKLALSTARPRNAGTGVIDNVPTNIIGNYWTGTVQSNNDADPSAQTLQISQFQAPSAGYSSSKAQGMAVRCIKE